MFPSLKKKTLVSTPFSDFIRNAKSDERKRVYKDVLEKATESQRQLIERARAKRK